MDHYKLELVEAQPRDAILEGSAMDFYDRCVGQNR